MIRLHSLARTPEIKTTTKNNKQAKISLEHSSSQEYDVETAITYIVRAIAP
jgi:hypothetical protein